MNRGLEEHDYADRIAVDYQMKRSNKPTAQADVQLFAVPHVSHDDEYACFVTNIDVIEATAEEYADVLLKL